MQVQLTRFYEGALKARSKNVCKLIGQCRCKFGEILASLCSRNTETFAPFICLCVSSRSPPRENLTTVDQFWRVLCERFHKSKLNKWLNKVYTEVAKIVII